jgi:hypothetical protein
MACRAALRCTIMWGPRSTVAVHTTRTGAAGRRTASQSLSRRVTVHAARRDEESDGKTPYEVLGVNPGCTVQEARPQQTPKPRGKKTLRPLRPWCGVGWVATGKDSVQGQGEGE